MLEKEQPDQYRSFAEYELANPEQARAVLSYRAYTNLCGLNHDRFWDELTYDNLKQMLGTTEPLTHPGVFLYDEETVVRPQPHAFIGRGIGSTIELAAIAEREIPDLRKKLEDWKEGEPEEYEKARGLIEVIQAGGLDRLDQKELRRILRSSVFHFPGIALSYQIKRDEQMIEDYKKSQDQQRTPYISNSGTTAKQRYEEYLRKKQQEEAEGN